MRMWWGAWFSSSCKYVMAMVSAEGYMVMIIIMMMMGVIIIEMLLLLMHCNKIHVSLRVLLAVVRRIKYLNGFRC